jgi:hypothetical protein
LYALCLGGVEEDRDSTLSRTVELRRRVERGALDAVRKVDVASLTAPTLRSHRPARVVILAVAGDG